MSEPAPVSGGGTPPVAGAVALPVAGAVALPVAGTVTLPAAEGGRASAVATAPLEGIGSGPSPGLGSPDYGPDPDFPMGLRIAWFTFSVWGVYYIADKLWPSLQEWLKTK